MNSSDRLLGKLRLTSPHVDVATWIQGPNHTLSERIFLWRLETRHAVGIPMASLPDLAEQHDQAPALVSDSMRVARLCEGGEARSDGALLIFDEADSLLADRRNAERRWEVSQVNEMLTWMESHPLPFVCTTNLVEKLDPATQRRFTFRIRFDHLSDAQLTLAWRAHFFAPVPEGLSRLDRLAPGDFANVARRMLALGDARPQEILRELAREAEAKEGAARPIGFGR